ncbi:hypothetical protein D3C80_1245630 [compost metagenome]
MLASIWGGIKTLSAYLWPFIYRPFNFLVIVPLRFFGKFFYAWWVNNHQQSHNFLIGISAFLTVITLVFGGYWTVHTFDLLNQADKARIELEDLKVKKRNMESSSISLNLTEIKKPKRGMIIEVEIVNSGQSSIKFNLNNNPLKVYEVEASGDEIGANKIYYPQYYSALGMMDQDEPSEFRTEVTLLIGAKKTLSYVITVDDEPKLYYITFEAGHDNTVASEPNSNWFASKYYEMK